MFPRCSALVFGQLANLTIDETPDTANLFELGGPIRLSDLIRDALSGNRAFLYRLLSFYELKMFGPYFLNTPGILLQERQPWRYRHSSVWSLAGEDLISFGAV